MSKSILHMSDAEYRDHNLTEIRQALAHLGEETVAAWMERVETYTTDELTNYKLALQNLAIRTARQPTVIAPTQWERGGKSDMEQWAIGFDAGLAAGKRWVA